MRLKSLRVKIAIHLAILLLVAIGLTNFVLLRIIEKNIVEKHIASGENWIASMHQMRASGADPLSVLSGYGNHFYPGIVYAMYAGEGEHSEFSRDEAGAVDHHARRLIEHAKSTKESAYLFVGREWGVFWKRSKYLIVAVPVSGGGDAGAAAIELGPDYEMLRNSQQVAIGYMFLNFLVLFAFGMYRFSSLVLRPIQRFIRLTDNYRYSEPFDFFPEKQHDEFSRLSSSLNRMVHRIDDDRQELEQSLEKIETANRDLKKAQQEIIRAEKLASIGRLSAGIAHEIGNPISIVLGYLGLLKTRSISPEDANGMDCIARAEVEIHRINDIIRQLLDFSRSTPTGFIDFSVHDVLHDTGRMLSQQPLMENIRLFYDFSASNDIVHADRSQLHQVIVNLFINAADSISAAADNPEQGEIRISTDVSEDGRWLCVSVQDNGCGIASENRDKIFDPFFTTKETGKGTGLGLYVSYMIIERFGGAIAIFDNEERGTRIVIELPLAGRKETNQQGAA
ncbi:MAG: ATP-binding protein [Desulfosalsimonadaceae bacterium]